MASETAPKAKEIAPTYLKRYRASVEQAKGFKRARKRAYPQKDSDRTAPVPPILPPPWAGSSIGLRIDVIWRGMSPPAAWTFS